MRRLTQWLLQVVVLSMFVLACGKVSNVAEDAGIQRGDGRGKLVIKTEALQSVVVAVPYKELIEVDGGIRPFKYSVSTGALYRGLVLDEKTGVISGTVDKIDSGKSATITFVVEDAAGTRATKAFELKTVAYTFEIAPSEIPSIVPETQFRLPLSAVGAAAPVRYTISGRLPTGISLSSDGIFETDNAGIPAAQQSTEWPVEVTASDVNGVEVTKSFTITVSVAVVTPQLVIQTQTLPQMTAGTPYTSAVAAAGGVPPYTYSVVSGVIPNGLTMDSATGIIAGTPEWTTSGDSYVFMVRVTDYMNNTTVRTYNGVVNNYTLELKPSDMPGASPEVAYQVSLVPFGGEGPYQFFQLDTNLPIGLTLNQTTGVISGTIAAAEANRLRTFSVRVLDKYLTALDKQYSITIGGYDVAITNTSLDQGYENMPYVSQLVASGGTPPYTFQYYGTLPDGLAMTNTGQIVGTPETYTGSVSGQYYSMTFRAIDSAGKISALKTLVLNIGLTAPAVTLAAGQPTDGQMGLSYSFDIPVLGGRPPYTFPRENEDAAADCSVVNAVCVSGNLATGLALSSAGRISGVPTELVNCSSTTKKINIRVKDSANQVSALKSNICVGSRAGLVITTDSLPVAAIGQGYNGQLQLQGGTGPFSYGAVGLPTGLNINPSTGAITGTVGGTFEGLMNVLFTASDSGGLASTKTISVRVSNSVVLATSAGWGGLTTATVGTDQTVPAAKYLAVTNGTKPRTISIVSGALPPGLSFTTSDQGDTFAISGTIANTAASATPYSVTVAVADAYEVASNQITLNLTVKVPPDIADSMIPPAREGEPYRFQIPVNFGVPPYTFSWSSWSSGTAGANSHTELSLTLGAASGVVQSGLVGSVTGTTDHTFQLTVTDSNGLQDVRAMSFRVVDALAATALSYAGARYSDVCSQATNAAAHPSACGYSKPFKIGKLVSGDTTNWAVYGEGVVGGSAWKLWVSRIDTNGRMSAPGADSNTYYVQTDWNNSFVNGVSGFVGDIDLADFDSDGNLDIVYTDYTNNRVVVLWNQGTSSGTPKFWQPATCDNSACTAIALPANGTATTFPFGVKAYRLKPSYTKSMDIVLHAQMDLSSAGNMGASAASRVVVIRSACDASTCPARNLIFASNTAYLTSGAPTYNVNANFNDGLRYTVGMTIGDFYDGCPAIVLVGRRATTNTSLAMVFKQGAGCDRLFTTSILKNLSDGSQNGDNCYPTAVTAGNFDGGTRDDIAVGFGNPSGNCPSEILLYSMESASSSPFFPATSTIHQVLPRLTSGTTYYTQANKLVPYCPDGTATCSGQKGLMAVMGREYYGVGVAGVAQITGVAMFADTSSQGTPVVYSLPSGLRSDPVLTPILTSSIAGSYADLAMMATSNDGYNTPFFIVLERNGSSVASPFKQNPMLLSFPTSFQSVGDVGTTMIADITGDGKNDIVSHMPNASSVTVQVNSGCNASPPVGDGQCTFGSAKNYPSGVDHGFYPYFHNQKTMAVADFNHDGKTDVAAVGYNSRGIGILIATGDPSDPFEPASAYSAGNGDRRPVAIAAGDLNADGNMDIVFASDVRPSNVPAIDWMAGNGDGTFGAPQTIREGAGTSNTQTGCPTANGSEIRSLAVADLDADQKPEIIALCYTNSTINIFRRNNAGVWKRNDDGSQSSLVLSNINAHNLTVGQLFPRFPTGTYCWNGASYCADLVLGVTNTPGTPTDPTPGLRVFRGVALSTPDGNGLFSANAYTVSSYQTGSQVSDLALGDLDMDGRTDLVISQWEQNMQRHDLSNTVTNGVSGGAPTYAYLNGQTYAVYRGNGTYGFQAREAFGMQMLAPTGIAAGRVNLDSFLDIILGYRPATSLYANYPSRLPFLNISQFMNLTGAPSQ